MKKVLLVSQTPLDVVYVLQLYLEHEGSAITILCVGSEGVHAYLQKLNLSAEIAFVRPVARKGSPLRYLRELRAQAREIVHQRREVEEVFYSSKYQDVYTSCLVESYYTHARVTRIVTGSHDLERYSSPLSLRDRIIARAIAFSLRLAAGIRTSVFKINGQFVFAHETRNVDERQILIGGHAVDRFCVSIDAGSGTNILLFESNGQEDAHFTNYDEELSHLIRVLRSLGEVHVKPHPTRGSSKQLVEMGVKVLSGDVPAAMLNLSTFRAVVGIDSAALKEVRHPNIISVIDSFSFRSAGGKATLKEYLQQGNGRNITFATTDEVTALV